MQIKISQFCINIVDLNEIYQQLKDYISKFIVIKTELPMHPFCLEINRENSLE